ncbi:MAG: flagellar filament capping protein FliD [Gemmataceae bacterium]|nr:flagellar filament capping protein FliD [Gemmataceae bacterium]
MASITGLNTNGLTFSGLATGINTDTLIAGLTKLNQQRIDTLKARQADVVSKQTTMAALQGKLYDLQAKTAGLARAAGGAFDGRTAAASDPAVLSAAAGTAAAPGTYSFTVTALAQAHQVASAGFADPNARIKEGTIALQVGSGATTTITVDGRNNTLQGLADSINAAGGEVRASVLNDGSGGTPYRLVLTAAKTGAANAITVTNNLSAGTGAAIDPTAKTYQAAADATIQVGSDSANVVRSASNQVDGLIPGVTLSLQKTSSGPVTVTVANDTAAASKAVADFVTSYNAVQDYIRDQSSFDADTKAAGTLLGNRDAAGLADDLSAALSAAVPGLTGDVNRLGAVGLSFDGRGKLNLDSAKLNQALSGAAGTTPADVKRLFGLTGTAGPGVAFVTGSDKTVPSGATPYQVMVTAAAARASVAASSPLPSDGGTGLVTINPPNTALSLKLNGLAAIGITIEPGTYTPEQVAALIQQKINAAQPAGGPQVAVGVDGSGRLTITNQQYGSGSKVELVAVTPGPQLGFAGTEAATGTDVAGKFVAAGAEEPATGAGQTLTGLAGNARTAGLVVRATAATPGATDLTVTQGLAGRLNRVLGQYLDPVAGRFKGINETYQKSIQDFDASITKQNDLMEAKKEELTRQFAAMESAVNNLKGLQTQLASLTQTSTTR